MNNKIAVIDDDIGILNIIESILSSNGYDVRTYSEIVGIVEELRQYLPSLILLDIHMPSKSGIDVLKEIKKDPVLKKIPVVMLTVDGNPSEIQMSILYGANTYILKPAKEKDILEIVRNLLVV
ncbi:MAG: response regulator [Elusimicrobiales bacterium]|nr:response regulator [Elusimicrobiales bacterium]